MGPGFRRGDNGVLPIQHDGQITSITVKSYDQKYFSLPEFGFTVCDVPSRARLRDVSRSSRYVGPGCDGRCGVRRACSPDVTPAAYGEVVWSWRRDRGVDPACLCGFGNGDNKRRSPGRARISRKAIAWGKPGCLGCTCSPCPCAYRTWDARVLRRAGSTGAVSARLSLRPLRFRGTTRLQDSGRSCRENAIGCLKSRTHKLTVVPGKRSATRDP